MRRLLAALGLILAIAAAQQKSSSPSPEQQDLDRALSEAGASPVEFLRAIESHLAKYPNSPRKPELERAAVRAAMDANDTRRIILYGERVLVRQPDDLQILEPVARSLVSAGSRDAAMRGLKYAQRYQQLVAAMRKNRPHDAEWQNQVDRGIARALRYEARATGNLGQPLEALALARRAFEQFPSAEAAREIAWWQEKLGNFADAARAMADAFTIQDPQATPDSRAKDRIRMGELWVKAKGSEAGLGDLVLEAYDRNLGLVRAREMRMRTSDPNARLTDPMQFTLSGLDGSKLQMSSLDGKVVVFDFWATWCGPCRVQHPLYAQVKQRFQDNPDVVFLSIDTDEDRALVKPFLATAKWPDRVYFEDGLSRALEITSIPTTIVTDRKGAIFSRMNGFTPEHFVETLTARIRGALED
jgi:thiol-disulfide isomerase/thioredoxin